MIFIKKKKPKILKYTKETPEARKSRVSSGVKFRAVKFEDKRRKMQKKVDEKDGSDLKDIIY